MKIEYGEHYDAAYWLGKKTYKTVIGATETYHGPSLDWDGFDIIAPLVAKLCPGKSLLDIGCGSGALANRFANLGYSAYGVDISDYAVKHAVANMRSRLACANVVQLASDCPPAMLDNAAVVVQHSNFDLVINTDFLEHIYEEDLESVLRWIRKRTNRWMFACVATTSGKCEFVLKRGQEVPKGYEGTAVSGHVNVREPGYWRKAFLAHGFKPRWDLMYAFQSYRETIPAWRDTGGWAMPNTWICEV